MAAIEGTSSGIIKSKDQSELEKQQVENRPDFIPGFDKSVKNTATSDTDRPMQKPKSGEGEEMEISNRTKNGNEYQLTGFARGLEPDKIIRAVYVSGELMHLVKWKGVEDTDLVPARETNVRCPQIVIEYYEKHLKWDNS